MRHQGTSCAGAILDLKRGIKRHEQGPVSSEALIFTARHAVLSGTERASTVGKAAKNTVHEQTVHVAKSQSILYKTQYYITSNCLRKILKTDERLHD